MGCSDPHQCSRADYRLLREVGDFDRHPPQGYIRRSTTNIHRRKGGASQCRPPAPKGPRTACRLQNAMTSSEERASAESESSRLPRREVAGGLRGHWWVERGHWWVERGHWWVERGHWWMARPPLLAGGEAMQSSISVLEQLLGLTGPSLCRSRLLRGVCSTAGRGSPSSPGKRRWFSTPRMCPLE